jgi:putative NIF3 family GTP cyclohydrolase 1 type 2
MRRTPLTAALVAAAALLLPACGGGEGGPSDDEKKVETVVRDYFKAFAAGDGTKACEQLGAETRVQLEKEANVKDCATAIEQATKRPEVKRYTKQLADVKIVEVNVSGGNATAKVQAIGQTTTVPLQREGDAWRITGATGAGGS